MLLFAEGCWQATEQTVNINRELFRPISYCQEPRCNIVYLFRRFADFNARPHQRQSRR